MSENKQSFSSNKGLLIEFWYFMKARKKWWLFPIILMIILLGIIVFLVETSPVSPFIYVLF